MFTRFTILSLLIILSYFAGAQFPRFSLGTDLGLLHNFQQEQGFSTIGYRVNANFHLTRKDGITTAFTLSGIGKYENTLSATARDISTNPQQLHYTNKGQMRFRQVTAGWKHYIRGAPDTESGWNLYGHAGFGLLLGRINNLHSPTIDTADYTLPVLQGQARFKRLTFDLGLGWEKPVGGDFYFYTEARVFIPSSDYPSPYILVNQNAPFAGMLGAGLRILF
ncbi:MAG: hypothetical protein HZA79_01770 [Sphingobacteriales bacterium]|nr:hypothetical protein [Sphingobacteriales bacterium]